MNTGESLCEDCGHELCCDQPALTTHIPLPATVKFYISLVRYGSAGWAAGPCGTDRAYILAALRAYTSIYPVSKVPTK